MQDPEQVEVPLPLAAVSLPTPAPLPSAPPLVLAFSVADFVLRLAYFLVIPFLLYFLSLVLPITAAVINLGLALAFFALGPLLQPLIAKRPWIGKPLKKLRRFEAYYREHRPRVFLYYLVFPLLFPYWLLVRRAREEFLLYRGLSVVALLILVGLGLYQYVTKWRPEIGFGVFLVVFGLVFIVQGVIVLSLMLPMATTVIGYHLAGKNNRLLVLLLAMIVSTSAAVYAHSKKRHGAVPAMTMARINARTRADEPRAAAAWRIALDAARTTKEFDLEQDGRADVQGGVEILGPPLENARAALETFYKDDEAAAFDLVVVKSPKRGLIAILYVPNGSRGPMWVAMDRRGKTTTDAAQLPEGTLDVLMKFAKK